MKVIGLMSGTSVDGIDAALVEITGQELDLKVQMLAGQTYPYPEPLREEILAIVGGKAINMAELADLDEAIAVEFANAALKIQHEPAELIGSHGQTVFHRAAIQGQKLGYSRQLGRGELIAHLTKKVTISNFRQADIAAGGQGAPLVPAIDAYWLGDRHYSRIIQNIGGIGNLTYIPAQNEQNWTQKVAGWDTGPGNALLDLAVQWLSEGKKTFDEDGQWAASGQPCQKLVEKWLSQPFFQEPPPKSTGRELFSEEYLQHCWQDGIDQNLTPADFLATLTELTVASFVLSYSRFLPQRPDQVLLCGGGSRNHYLKRRLRQRLDNQTEVLTTDEVGVNGDFKEAIAFAILAYWRLNGTMSSVLPLVTGASQPVLLGEIHEP